jgi:hypothetical protein
MRPGNDVKIIRGTFGDTGDRLLAQAMQILQILERLSFLISTFDLSLPKIITYDLRLLCSQFKELNRHRTDNSLFGCGSTPAPPLTLLTMSLFH